MVLEIKGINVKKILDEMTLEEKVSILTGEGYWHIRGVGELPSVRLSDGATGLVMRQGASNLAVQATCFPTASALGCSWDVDLVKQVGCAIGEEATALGVNVVLAPGVNIKRNPLGGRNFDYYSEDPFLSGELGGAYIQGVQSTEVGACLKHYVANSQESYRHINDCVIDERALFEIYLAPFERALKANPSMLMCASNKVNGQYCSQNAYLMTDILRGRFGYKGVTVSDFGAVHDRIKSFEAGLDLLIPDDKGLYSNALVYSAKMGRIDEQKIDEAVYRIIELVDNVYLDPYGDIDWDGHQDVAYKSALGCITLLKNDGVLPLTANKKIALMGEVAAFPKIQGEGSSEVNAIGYKTAVGAFTHYDRAVDFFKGYGHENDDIENVTLRREAVEGSVHADVCVVFVALDKEQEQYDRVNMRLPKCQDELIDALLLAGRKVVIVLNTGTPVEMPWVNRVCAIVQAGLSGSEGALATVDVLLGRQNPQGRLAETYPVRYRDCISSEYFAKEVAEYRESVYVGYRYYDTVGMQTLFPFGHGLNYSNIVYNDLSIVKTDSGYTAKISITNDSTRGAYEVVQLYVSDLTDTVFRPKRELKGFKKVYVDANTTQTVSINLDFRSFAFYDTAKKDWAVGNGVYRISVGPSSAVLPLYQDVTINGDGVKDDAPQKYRTLNGAFLQNDFTSLIKTEIAQRKTQPYTTQSTLNDLKQTLIGKILIRKLTKGLTQNQIQLTLNTPLDVIYYEQNWTVKGLLSIIDFANGKYFSALKKYFTRNKKGK